MGVHAGHGKSAAVQVIPLITGRGHEGYAPYAEVQRGRRLPGFDQPERIDVILAELDRRGGYERRDPEAHGEDLVRRVHDDGMLAFLRLATNRAGAGEEGLLFADTFLHPGAREVVADSKLGFHGQFGKYCLDTITSLGPATLDAALESVDCALTAAELVDAGSPLAVALTRPPGHHSSAAHFGGGTYLNNAAIATESLLEQGHDRVAVLDLDIHHGNGSQSIFYRRDDVLVTSVHADPAEHYPFFLGFEDEVGTERGRGYNLNLVLDPEAAITPYLWRLDSALSAISDFAADVLVVSLGVDGHRRDPAQAATLETSDFSRIGAAVADLALPTLALLEGGYAIEVVGPSVAGWLDGFAMRQSSLDGAVAGTGERAAGAKADGGADGRSGG